jgi:hypothetical protein
MLGVLRAIGALVLLSALSTACSPDGRSPGRAPGDPPVSPEAGIPDAVDLGLPEPTDGFQIRSHGAEIAPGEEHEYCEVARLPGGPDDEYYVSLIELANGPSSHHLALGVAASGSAGEAEIDGLGAGHRVECAGPRIEFGEGLEVVATIQIPHGQAALPAGVARKYRGGQYIVFDYHYANTGIKPISARSAVNFHIVDKATVEHVAQTFVINNVTIDTPPGKTGSFVGECHFNADMKIGAFTRHTHHWGTDFTVSYVGGERDGEEIWTSHDWQHETEYTFVEPAVIHAGEGLRYRCDYANDTPKRLRFGTSVRDEMCMLYGPAWSAHEGEELNLEGCNIVWIDDAGIGHPANEAGGFPKADPSDESLCKATFGPDIDECSKCRCEACATPGLKCTLDKDCGPLLSCYLGCTDAQCIEGCKPVLKDHSSGQGLFTQIIACSYSQCPACGTPTDIGL